MGRCEHAYRGQPDEVTPAAQLQIAGPLIRVIIERPRPNPEQPGPGVPGLALIDTGADRGVIDSTVVTALGLDPVRTEGAHGVGGRVELEIYNVHLSFPAPLLLEVDAKSQSKHDLESLNARVPPELGGKVVAIIGRDLLQHLVFFYNGPNGMFALQTTR